MTDPDLSLPPIDRPPFPNVPGYEIESELGRGGLGMVYRARQLALNRTVALKIVLGGHSERAGQRGFLAGLAAFANLSHPGVVRILDAGEVNGMLFCSMEFCSHSSLADRLRDGPLPAREAADIVRQLADTVQHVHSHSIVHRDLKPANVLSAADGSLKITSFGLARHLDTDREPEGAASFGTPAYMPPEQWTNAHRAGPPADIWALGVILYECLTGRKPFTADTMQNTMSRVLNEEPTAMGAAVPGDLDAICRKCLRKEPTERYASASALADDLRRWQEGRPISARPTTPGERAVMWIRRNPVVSALLTQLVLALVFGSVVATWFGLDAREHARRANLAGAEAEAAKREAEKQRENARLKE